VKQWGVCNLNCDWKFFAKLEISDTLISTIGSESEHEYRNCNCVIVVKSATYYFEISRKLCFRIATTRNKFYPLLMLRLNTS